MTQFGTEIDIRPAIPADLNFIFDTFRESVRCDTAIGRSCRTSVFKREFSKVIDHILSKATVLISCRGTDPNIIIGYLIFEPNIVHYCFVKQAFRGLGIAKNLFKEAFPNKPNQIDCSFKTQSMRALFDAHSGLTHNPFNLFKQGVSND